MSLIMINSSVLLQIKEVIKLNYSDGADKAARIKLKVTMTKCTKHEMAKHETHIARHHKHFT